MLPFWDLFFSYRRNDLSRAQALLDALAQAGVQVWRDERDIPEQASITTEIRRAIANSKGLVAFYSRTYPASNPCQQEITTAWLAARQVDQIANRRIWIVNPETSFEHIPELLRDQQIPLMTNNGAQVAAIVQGIKDRLALLGGTLLGNGVLHLPQYHGMSAIQATRFAGRATEMWDLHGRLTADRISIITGVYGQAAAQVRGLGGNGKSLLAREYSIRFGQAYPGGVFWLNAYGHDDSKGSISTEQRESLRQEQVREFAIRSMVSTDGLKPAEIEAFFWQTTKARGEPCLWIVDDVPPGLSSPELERTWYARWTGAATMVTTRSKEYSSGTAVELGTLSPQEALGLLCSHRKPGGSAEEGAAHRIADLLGNHPLAIEVAGGYLAQGIESFESYAEALENPLEDAVEFGALLKTSLPTGHERSISATLLKSIRQLEPEGLDFLRLASILAVAPIQVSLLSEVFEGLDGTGKINSLRALDQVGTLSLCEHFGDDARTVHTLVSRTMRFKFPTDGRTIALRLAAVRTLTQRIRLFRDVGEHSRLQMDMPHARQLVASEPQSRGEAELALLVANLDYERGDYSSAQKLEEQVLALCRGLLGEENPATLTAMNNLAQSRKAQGDLEGARRLQEQVRDVSRRVLGGEHPGTLMAMNNFAETLAAQGDARSAQKLLDEVLGVSRRVLGDEHPNTLATMNNLASTLSEQGDAHAARELLGEVLEVSRRMLGREHPRTLATMNNLAQALQAQGDWVAARTMLDQVLEASRRVLGEAHPNTLLAMNNVAGMLYAQGDVQGARSLVEEMLDLTHRILGEEHPDTLMAMNNVAQTLKAQGHLPAARKLQGQVMAASRRVLGEEHPNTLKAKINFAQTLQAQGDIAGAQKLLAQVLEASRRQFGEKHPVTLGVALDVAGMLSSQRDFAGARRLQEQVLADYRLVLGERHPDTLRAMSNLAATISSQGKLAEARNLQKEVLAGCRLLMGEEHQHTLGAMNNLARTLYDQGSLGGAQKLQEKTLASSRRLLGEEHPDTLKVMNNLAHTMYAQGSLRRARKLLEQVLAVRRRLLGEEHPDTVAAMEDFVQMTSAEKFGKRQNMR